MKKHAFSGIAHLTFGTFSCTVRSVSETGSVCWKEGGGRCRELREGKMLIPEESCIFYCIENEPKANVSHVLNRSIFFLSCVYVRHALARCLRYECQ